jgi:hypothetical protein
LPAALVSEVIAPAVAVPELDAPNAGVAQVSVAAIAPAAEMRKHSLLPAPSSWSTTALVAASLLAVLWVTAILSLLQKLFVGFWVSDSAGQFDFFNLPSFFTGDLHSHSQLAQLSLHV